LRLRFFLAYFPDNPYRVVRREGPSTGLKEGDLIYGETLNLTFKAILDSLDVNPCDVFVDLGCGRGMGLFFIHFLYGLPCLGYEAIPTFVRKACRLRCELGAPGIEIVQKSFLECEPKEGTIFFVAGTTFDDATLEGLARLLAGTPPGTRIISLSSPLAVPGFAVFRREEHLFSWGTSTVYLQHRPASPPPEAAGPCASPQESH